MIVIRAYRATGDLNLNQAFLDGHQKVLEEFNLSNISTNTPKWFTHNNTIVLVVEYNGSLIGGARIQIVDDELSLPVIDAVAHFDEKIYSLVAEKKDDGGACELCGLWNARVLPPNLGLTRMVSVAAVSIVNQLNIKNIFAICAGYTLYPAMRMGMVIQKSVGENGEFVYPNSNFRARVLCMNGFTLETSNAEFKRDILEVRSNPTLETTITIEGIEVPLKYNLVLD